MEKENRSINLLGEKGKNTADILLLWALYIGRLLIILTETAALIVLVSRFSIDRKLIDYSDSIKKQQKFVEYFQQGEESFRKTHLKLAVSKSNNASSSAVIKLFAELLQEANDQLGFTTLNVSPSSLTITAQAVSVDTLGSFTQRLKEHPSVTSLSIDKVESKPKSALISITITAQLAKPKPDK